MVQFPYRKLKLQKFIKGYSTEMMENGINDKLFLAINNILSITLHCRLSSIGDLYEYFAHLN